MENKWRIRAELFKDTIQKGELLYGQMSPSEKGSVPRSLVKEESQRQTGARPIQALWERPRHHQTWTTSSPTENSSLQGGRMQDV